MGSFDELRKQMDKLKDTAKSMAANEGKSSRDERFFRPKKDSSGNISCIIRFLPQLDFSKPPYVEKPSHYITISGKMFAAGCTEFDEKDSCPVCAKSKPHWSEYWALRNAHGKEYPGCKDALREANKWSRNVQTVTNILVVKNPMEPETEGKVFMYNMPKDVLSKFKQKVMPKDDLDEMAIVFHPIEGRNFKLDGFTKKVDENNEFTDYSNSYFQDKTIAISENEDYIMKVLNETHDLQKYLDESKPNKDDVEKRFKEFLKFTGENFEEKKEPAKQTSNPKEQVSTVEDSIGDEIDEISESELDDLFD